MECREFRERLTALAAGALARRDADRAWEHLDTCPDCARRFDAVAERAVPPELVQGVLRRTGSDPCTAARERLCEHVDGTLPRIDTTLIDGHLDACAACRGIAAALREMARELPAWREIDPGSGFAAAVLARTLPAGRRAAPSAGRWVETLRELARRPRFAWEAAWVASVIALLALGGPDALRPAAPRRAIASAHSAAAPVVVHDLRAGFTAAGDALGSLATRSAATFAALGERMGTLRDSLASETMSAPGGDSRRADDEGAETR